MPAENREEWLEVGCGAYLRHPLQLHFTHIHLCYTSILVMKASENWEGHDGASATMWRT